MNERLAKIISYKTGGKQRAFAELLGWSPQYLAKLLSGGNFGLQPVLSVLSAFPEINARWLLFGEGNMIAQEARESLHRLAVNSFSALLDLEKYIPVMSEEEIREFSEALECHRLPNFTDERLAAFAQRLNERQIKIDRIFKEATTKSNELCNPKTHNVSSKGSSKR